MEILALLSNRDDILIPIIKGAIGKYTLYPLKTVDEVEELYSNIPLNLLLIDTISFKITTIRDFLDRVDEGIIILITEEKVDQFTREALPRSVFDCVDEDSISELLPHMVERALERQRFKNEIKMLKQTMEDTSTKRNDISTHIDQRVTQKDHSLIRDVLPSHYEPVPSLSGRYVQERIIVNFARMLSVSFDMRRLLEYFIDSVMEIARVSKVSIMRRDKDGFRIKMSFGIDPSIVEKIVLRNDSALVTWLTRTGRILQKPSSYIDPVSVDIRKEMDLLQCSVSFPMIYKGKLIGILNIDNKITEEPFYREELEIIYVLCNYLAAAIKDIDLYHQIWYQKEFTNTILSSMNSGMIAIDRDGKITVFNQQAAEILNLNASKMVGNNLNVLPSPLSDILYETLVTGKSYRRYEATLGDSGIFIGINSYRVIDEHDTPLGAGVIFSDITASKRLEEQRSRIERLQAMNDLMAKIAHEIRNPLTSIHTYTELLNEKIKDDELQKFYITTVRDSIKRLDGLIDKLITFSSTRDYYFTEEQASELLAEAVKYASRFLSQAYKVNLVNITRPVYINADRTQFLKAIKYLFMYISDTIPEGTNIHIRSGINKRFFEMIFTYRGKPFKRDERINLSSQLLDIDHLGTELNLPLIHKIIEAHSGEIEIREHEEMNSFIIRLPLVEGRSVDVNVHGGIYE